MQSADGDVLMTFRRPWYDRVVFHVVPVGFAFGILLAILQLVVGGGSAGERVFLSIWVLFASYLVWQLAFRQALDFACTRSGIELTTVIGHREFIQWHEMREYRWFGPLGRSQIGRGLPSSNHAILIAEGHPRLYMFNMSADPLADLEALLRQGSNARIVGGGSSEPPVR